jgi:LAO/AO transport system kinase
MTGVAPTPALDRRALAKSLTRSANASVAEILSRWQAPREGVARRIGITGAPGTGKSTLISHLASCRLALAERIGVLAIDPTSPFSQGAILGDRVRMDAVVDDDRLFIRSLASRSSHDGLTDNIADLLTIMDVHGFDEVMLETVGVGQTDYAVRTLVDTVVLVLIPECGDQIQAMKAGLMETADIYVINKADLPGASRVANEVRTVLARARRDGTWQRRVVEASAVESASIEALSQVVSAHQTWVASNRQTRAVRRARAAYHAKELLARRLSELIDGAGPQLLDLPLPAICEELVVRLGWSDV